MERLLSLIRSKRTGALGFLAFVVGYLQMSGELDALPPLWGRVVAFVGAMLAWLGFSPVRAAARPQTEGES